MLSIGIGLDWGGGWRFFFWEYWKDANNANYDLKKKVKFFKKNVTFLTENVTFFKKNVTFFKN